MVQINFGQREVSCKLVYYGPGMSGKTTNLEIIHQKAPDTARGEMVSIATETDRTLYFDFLPLDLGQVAGMHTKFQLYTVPGQVYYNATRKLVLQGVDGVIFVADSNPEKMDENLESLENLRENLAGMGIKLDEIPFVLQYNKRDLPNAMSVPDMDRIINKRGVPSVEAVARDGKGVFATLKELSKLVIDKLNREHAPAAQRRRTGSNLTPVGGTRPSPSPTPSSQAVAAVTPQTAPQRQTAPPPRQSAPPPQQAAPPPPASHPGYAPTPRHGSPAAPPPRQQPASAKERHLQKAKPPALKDRGGDDNTNLGPTDPHLKRFKQAAPQKSGGGMLRTLSLIVLTLLIIIIITFLLMLFVPEVADALAPYLPDPVNEIFKRSPPEPAG